MSTDAIEGKTHITDNVSFMEQEKIFKYLFNADIQI